MVTMRGLLLASLLVLLQASGNAQTGSYEQDVITKDGPIVYGAYLSDADRQRAWKSFFMMMVETAARQRGQEALGTMLMRRCPSGEDFCSTIIDADLVGIGGIREPRKVLLVIATDPKDEKKMLNRMVCTRPAPGLQVCRDWDTGQLIRDEEQR